MRPAELPAFTRGGGARTIPLVTQATGAEIFLTGQTLFDGGAGIPLHTHNCPESVTILEGDAIAEIDGTEHHLTRFDTTYVAADTPTASATPRPPSPCGSCGSTLQWTPPAPSSTPASRHASTPNTPNPPKPTADTTALHDQEPPP
ncbi:conserved hypothetical protein [Streptomyces himastatinicus ATCC 53653]|uniref:Cupin domain protein n=1 Tax=Streptomyces himastatinicus ATCC 53653 TaxID=457427 RepID=D9WCF1_9ACTN|nr:hypothetical protein [Streptomyces himastatinicus]EFL20898.1 conserved hypothetical protein [Streptomyces himastatinicus ATCC 53653]